MLAGYSENREVNLEIKYLRRVLCAIEPPVPESLRGDRMLELIANIPAPKTKAELIIPKKWLNWRSGVTYAAAFLLIVGLSWGLGRPGDDVISGELSLAVGESSEADQAPKAGEDGPDGETEQLIAEVDGIPITHSPEEYQPASSGATQDGGEGSVFAQPQAEGDSYAVGGSESVYIGEIAGGYALVYRSNEGNPDIMAEAPYALELLNAENNLMVSRVDIPKMTEISFFFTERDKAAIVGKTQDGALILSVDFKDPENPVAKAPISQPGELLDARVNDGILHVLSFAPGGEATAQSVTELPGSVEEGACVITALDLYSAESAQRGFTGAGRNSRLYRVSAYLEFYQADPEGEFPLLRNAKISLDGLNLDLEEIA